MFKVTTKSMLTLLLLGVHIASVYTQGDPNDAWTCNHDNIEHPPHEFIDVEEKGFKDAQEGRLLASTSYSNIRMYGYYGFLSAGGSDYESYMSEELLPPILSYFEGALKVKYPVSGTFKISTSSICGKTTPSILRSGVNADFVYIFASESASGTWVASTSSCSLASGSRRPLVGMTTINTALFKSATNNVLLHEKNMLAIMHELTHTLGFSTSLFNYFLDSSGKTLSGHILSGTLDGISGTVINVSPLTSKLQSYFGCSSLKGAYMENNGAAGAVAGSHFERRHFGFEAMTAYLVYEMKYSEFSLAMLEGSGWYEVDYSYADPFFFGKGEGCTFLTGSCSSINSQFSEFCTSSSRKCAVPGRGGGSCSSDTVSDSCKFIHPSVEYDCGNTDAESYARLPSIQTFGRGTGSKCFEGTLGGSSATTYCFKYSCDTSGSSTILNIDVGSKTVECTAKSSKTVSGYSGTITCPDPATWCSTVGAKICPRGCMGRGTCVNGVCSCYNGFKGEDCGLNA